MAKEPLLGDDGEVLDTRILEEFTRNALTNILPLIHRATVPFYVLQGKTIARGHTGVFLRIAEKRFLLTAAHSFREFIDAKLPILVGWDPDDRRPIHLENTDFMLGDPKANDVAVATLNEHQWKALSKEWEPITVPQMRRRDDSTNGLFLVCGCPQAWTHRTEDGRLVSVPINYVCYKHDHDRPDDPFADLKFDRRMHCLFTFERVGMNALTHEELTLPPKQGIEGISGCGVWKIGEINDRVLTRYAADDVYLCGIEHRYNQDHGYVIATWLEQAVGALVERHPETRKVFEMHDKMRLTQMLAKSFNG